MTITLPAARAIIALNRGLPAFTIGDGRCTTGSVHYLPMVNGEVAMECACGKYERKFKMRAEVSDGTDQR